MLIFKETSEDDKEFISLLGMFDWFLRSFFTVSMFTCVGFAIDRYYALTKLSKYNRPKSRRNTKMLIVSYWIVGFIFTSFHFIKRYPIFKWMRITLFPVPLVMFIVINVTVYKKLNSKIININEESKMRHEIRTAQTFIIMFFVYIVLFCPFFTMKYVADIIGFNDFSSIENIRCITRNFMLLNSCLNSLIYAYRVKVVRDDIKNLFGISSESSKNVISSEIRSSGYKSETDENNRN